jgi:hypothetical protein
LDVKRLNVVGFSRVTTDRMTAAAGVLILLLGLGVPLAERADAQVEATVLDCEPETDTNPVGTDHEITCTSDNDLGLPAGTDVDVEIIGANDPDDGDSPDTPDKSCTTSPNSLTPCVINHGPADDDTTNEVGTTIYRAWIADAGPPDETEPRDETAEGATDADGTDVVEKTWAPRAATGVDVEPESDVNDPDEPHEITAYVFDQEGDAFADGTSVSFEFFAGSPSDPSGDGGNTPESPDETCTTSDASTTDGSTCSITYTHSGSSGGTDLICAWINDQPVMEGDESDGTCDGEAAEDDDDAVDEPDEPDPVDDDQDVVSKTWRGASGVDAEPEQDTNDTGTNHSVTATVYDQFGDELVGNSTVNFEFFQGSPRDGGDGNSPGTPDLTCPTSDSSSCSVTYVSNAAGTDLLCVWVDTTPEMSGNNTNGTCDGEERDDPDDQGGSPDAPEPADDNVDVVQKRWIATSPTAARRLDCTPETGSNPVRTSHSITCTATAPDSTLVAGANIDFEATGANDLDGNATFTDPDFTCQTGSNGQCTITHGPSGQGTTFQDGTTTYRAWIDEDGNNGTTEADQTEGRDETASASVGTTEEPDNTDVVEKEWEAREGRTIDCEPESAVNTINSNHTVTCVVKDRFGDPVEGTSVTFSESGSGTFVGPEQQITDAQGEAEATFTSDETGTQTITGTLTEDTGPGEPNEVDECDRAAGDPAGAPEGMCSDQVSKTWTEPGGRNIDCEPETATNQTGTEHTVICTVTDAAGQPDQGRSVTFTETGPGEFASASKVATGPDGKAQVTVTSSQPGEQSINGTLTDDLEGNEPAEEDECDRAAGDPAGAPAGNCSDSVSKTWQSGGAECSDGIDNDGDGDIDFPNDAGCGSAQDNSEDSDQNFCPGHANDKRNQVVGTSGADILEGTPRKDVICGLGGSDVLKGFGRNDLLLGGGGKDELRGGKGDDTLKGGAGADQLFGGGGDDKLAGGGKADVLRGGGGNDILRGNKGNDTLRGGRGNDVMRGGPGRDRCAGGPGRDRSFGCEN